MYHTLFLQHTKMFNLDGVKNEHNEEHNLKQPYISDHSYRMLIIGGSGSGKTNELLNLIKEQDFIFIKFTNTTVYSKKNFLQENHRKTNKLTKYNKDNMHMNMSTLFYQ